jgi:hypothetical protein
MNSVHNRPRTWPIYHYYRIFPLTFAELECNEILRLGSALNVSVQHISVPDGRLVRDSNIGWLPNSSQTAWIFSRISDQVKVWNESYEFSLGYAPETAQLTQYSIGQTYDWHMDLGSRDASLRKVSSVLALNNLS